MGLPCFSIMRIEKQGQFFCGGKGAGYAPVIGLIVENRNTCDDNSPTVPLTEKQIAELRACAVK